LAFTATIDIPARYKNFKAVRPASGLRPILNQSGESYRIGRISRCGDGRLRTLLCRTCTITDGRVILARVSSASHPSASITLRYTRDIPLAVVEARGRLQGRCGLTLASQKLYRDARHSRTQPTATTSLSSTISPVWSAPAPITRHPPRFGSAKRSSPPRPRCAPTATTRPCRPAPHKTALSGRTCRNIGPSSRRSWAKTRDR
jgi:Transposase IS116/IS110/IS902 family